MNAAKQIAMLVTAAMLSVAACGDAPTAVDRSAEGVQPAKNHITSYITGPNPVTCSGLHTYDSNPGGGSSYTYAWSYSPDEGGWYPLGTDRTATQWIDVGDSYMTFRVDVTSGGHTSTSYLTVTGPSTHDIC